MTDVERAMESATGWQASKNEKTLAAEVARLEAELAAASALLAKATQFKIIGWRVEPWCSGWVAYGDDFCRFYGTTAAEAVAAAQKASKP